MTAARTGRPAPIAITGMHRSGTSMITRALHDSGPPPGRDRRRGADRRRRGQPRGLLGEQGDQGLQRRAARGHRGRLGQPSGAAARRSRRSPRRARGRGQHRRPRRARRARPLGVQGPAHVPHGRLLARPRARAALRHLRAAPDRGRPVAQAPQPELLLAGPRTCGSATTPRCSTRSRPSAASSPTTTRSSSTPRARWRACAPSPGSSPPRPGCAATCATTRPASTSATPGSATACGRCTPTCAGRRARPRLGERRRDEGRVRRLILDGAVAQRHADQRQAGHRPAAGARARSSGPPTPRPSKPIGTGSATSRPRSSGDWSRLETRRWPRVAAACARDRRPPCEARSVTGHGRPGRTGRGPATAAAGPAVAAAGTAAGTAGRRRTRPDGPDRQAAGAAARSGRRRTRLPPPAQQVAPAGPRRLPASHSASPARRRRRWCGGCPTRPSASPAARGWRPRRLRHQAARRVSDPAPKPAPTPKGPAPRLWKDAYQDMVHAAWTGGDPWLVVSPGSPARRARRPLATRHAVPRHPRRPAARRRPLPHRPPRGPALRRPPAPGGARGFPALVPPAGRAARPRRADLPHRSPTSPAPGRCSTWPTGRAGAPSLRAAIERAGRRPATEPPAVLDCTGARLCEPSCRTWPCSRHPRAIASPTSTAASTWSSSIEVGTWRAPPRRRASG